MTDLAGHPYTLFGKDLFEKVLGTALVTIPFGRVGREGIPL